MEASIVPSPLHVVVEVPMGCETMVENDDEKDKQWTPHPLKFEVWIGCIAHQIQLVVNDGYDELKAYCRVQAIFVKAKGISALSLKPSHFDYSLALKIPVPNDTLWNSHFLDSMRTS